MINKDFKKKRDEILYTGFGSRLSKLNMNNEDIILVNKLTETYCRKIKGVSNSKLNITSAAILWVYSKINYFWEGDEKWSRQGLADLFGANSKSVGNKAAEIMKALKIEYWDDRFARKSIAEKNPLKEMVMLPSGMIALRKNIPQNIPFAPLKKTKEDYFYDGLDYLDEGDTMHALICFKKALEIDENYVDAYNGLGNLNMLLEDYKKSKEYYQKAYFLTKDYFKGIWPTELEWGILENRQYLRAICGFALCYWREGNIQEAERLFSLLLRLNKGDNQGARFIMAAILEKISFEQYDNMQKEAAEKGNYDKIR